MPRVSRQKHRLDIVLDVRLHKKFLERLEEEGIPTASEWVRARILEFVNRGRKVE